MGNMEVSIFSALQLIVTAGFTIGMLLAAAKAKQLRAEASAELVEKLDGVERRIDEKIDARVGVMRREIEGVKHQIENMDTKVIALRVDVAVINALVLNGNKPKT